ncbi:RluA family pseudouridine synthase [Dongia sp.]|jgi:tRNA pseudouridine32 synthase/23S rRNA pseudouridine746 synthase/23S rRNA pseudouridine1911/1915/1917 synthase|uniref:RluA family pseudouridine synthase n=1 Tax=Dongia sp. TaxID=1977262 RepID=UPI0035B0C3A4
MTPQEIQARLLYRDALMLVIDKPAGLPVHAGPSTNSRGGGPNLERDFEHLRFGLPKAPALAHRLDRDTSGCLALGRQHKGLSRLGKLFQEGKIGKTYWAVTTAAPAAKQGTITASLKKLTTRAGGWRMVVVGDDDKDGQKAVTDYKLLGSSDHLHWLELSPRTGRTHQIRVHLSHLGCPILGEPQYLPAGSPKPSAKLHLHSRSLVVPLYPKKDPIRVEAPPPPHMLEALRACGYVTG